MHFKKLISNKITILILVLTFVFVTVGYTLAITNKANPNSEESKAWLADVQIREDSTKMEKAVPIPDVEFNSMELKKLRIQSKAIMSTINPDLSSVEESYSNLLKKLLEKTGFEDLSTTQEKISYLKEKHLVNYGSSAPEDNSNIYTELLYYALKYNLADQIIGEKFKLPANINPKDGVFLLVKKIYGNANTEKIDNLKDFALNDIKKTLSDNNVEIKDKTPEELMLLYKAVISKKMGTIPSNIDLNSLSAEKIDISYAKGVIEKAFNTKLSNESIQKILNTKNSEILVSEVLKNKINGAKIVPVSDTDVDKLYKQAFDLGLYDIEEEFYSDIYKYNVNLKHEVDAVWFTPFTSLAEYADEDLNNLSVLINGEPANHGRSFKIEKREFDKPVKINLIYKNNDKVVDKKTYVFKIKNGTIPLAKNEQKLVDTESVNYEVKDVKEFELPANEDFTNDESLNTNLAQFYMSQFSPYEIKENIPEDKTPLASIVPSQEIENTFDDLTVSQTNNDKKAFNKRKAYIIATSITLLTTLFIISAYVIYKKKLEA
ncbi:MAG: hypothetical protein Q4E28_04130 [Clostridia bacterium]|nr:hypothetical protein [Clostridia bacterium]